MTDLSKVIREETYKLIEKASLKEKSPPGWSGTTKAMKKHKDIDNPWALAHWMKKRGAKPHYKPETVSVKEEKLFQIIKEEFDVLVKEAQKNESKIIEKLETMRKGLIRDDLLVVNERGSARNDIGSRPERRIPLETVAKVIDIPVNELILHFLNGHRVKEGHTNLCEYRLGCVYFYGKQTKEGIVEGKDVFDKHQKKIAKDTLKMPDAMVGVMGGPDKKTAKDILKKKTKKTEASVKVKEKHSSKSPKISGDKK